MCFLVPTLTHPSLQTPLVLGSSSTMYPLINYVTCAKFSSVRKNFLAVVSAGVEPKSFKQAMLDL